MQVHRCVTCVALAFALGAASPALAQRRAPRATHRGAVPRPAAPIARPHAVRPPVAARPHYRSYYRPAYRGPYYRPSYYGAYYRRYYRSTVGLGIYIGYPYGYYPYPYPYSYPPAYAYPYPYPSPYPYGSSVAVVPDDSEPAPVTERAAEPVQAPAVARGTIAIEGTPTDATIYVDGNYAGRAADFGAVQPLSEPAGYHEIEIRAPGRRPVVVHLDVQPNRTLTYRYPAAP